MSSKSKKKARSRARRLAPHPSASPATFPAHSVSQSRVGGDVSTVRSVEMSLGVSNKIVRRSGRTLVESSDPAIPLDRVPYFTSDLIRVGITALIMLVLLAIGALVIIPRFVA